MATVSRIECPKCRASCIDGETNCWQCGTLLQSRPAVAKPTEPNRQADPPKRSYTIRFPRPGKSQAPQPTEPEPKRDLIQYDPEHLASIVPPPAEEIAEESAEEADLATAEVTVQPCEPAPPTAKRTRVTLTGEVVEEDDVPLAAPVEHLLPSTTSPAATIGGENIDQAPAEEVMVLTFCKNCGFQNQEGVRECAQCGKVLDVIAVSAYREIEALPRAWGFDILGAVWVILGISAIFAGQFLVQTNAARPPSIADYLWTGVVAVAPGVLVIMRHHFCRMLFWVMTLGSAMVWGVIFVVWILGHLHVSDKGQVGLTWLFALSCLSVVSFFLVRTNDAFDYDIGVWLGRE